MSRPEASTRSAPNRAQQLARRPARRARLAILVNTIAPYRIPIYAALAKSFEALVLHGGREANRSWTLDLPEGLKTREVWTLQIPTKKQTGIAGVWDTQYLHLNGGLLWWLPIFRPDVILSNELGLRTLLALLYGRLARVPVWVQWEGTLHSERNVQGLKRRLRGLLAKVIRHWVSYGAGSSAYLHSLGVSPAQVLEVQNSVPHRVFADAPAVPANWLDSAPKPVILSVGQMIRRKGLHTLVDACGRLAARHLPFTLVLVGEGPERADLVEQARTAGIEHVHLLPNQSQEVLSGIYRAADVFVFPTLEDVWGLVANEALWAGTPVLCSQYAGCAEILGEENLFDPLSAESFDDALTRFFAGRIRPASTERMMTCEQVSEALCRALAESTSIERGTKPPRSTHHPIPEAITDGVDRLR